jgi:hypothetical protein
MKSMKSNAPSFERLAQVAAIIAQHVDYPGKGVAVAECMVDVEDRWTRGLLTLEQRLQLLAILVKGAAPRWEAPLSIAV